MLKSLLAGLSLPSRDGRADRGLDEEGEGEWAMGLCWEGLQASSTAPSGGTITGVPGRGTCRPHCVLLLPPFRGKLAESPSILWPLLPDGDLGPAGRAIDAAAHPVSSWWISERATHSHSAARFCQIVCVECDSSAVHGNT